MKPKRQFSKTPGGRKKAKPVNYESMLLHLAAAEGRHPDSLHDLLMEKARRVGLQREINSDDGGNV